MEALEQRSHLSAEYVNGYDGALRHGTFSHTIASLYMDVSSQSRHGVIFGAILVRFAKHDAVTYYFSTRVIHGKLDIELPTGAYVDGRITLEQVEMPYVPVATISGVAQFAGHYGAFQLVPVLTPG
jgi:hypothetical protein